MRMPESVELRHLFDMHVDLEPAQVIASPEVSSIAPSASTVSRSNTRITP